MNPKERLVNAMRWVCIGGGLVAAFVLAHSIAYQDELDKELAIVEACNAKHRAAYRDKDGRMKCASVPWAFSNPMKGGIK